MRRLAAIPVLDSAGDRAPTDGWHLITARGVEADAATVSAAVAYAERTGLKVLDLLPGSLDAERALSLLRLLELGDARFARTTQARGAGQAVLIAEDVRSRAGVEIGSDLDTAELHALLGRVKEYAAGETGIAIAPGLTVPSPELSLRPGELRAQGLPPGVLTAAHLAGLALLARAAVKDRRWGAAALALYWLQPALVLGAPNSPLRPADLPRATAARPLHSLHAALRTAATLRPAPAGPWPEVEALRPGYEAELKAGTERFFEPRRPDCPWCGSTELCVRTRMPDQFQAKPGRFSLEQCGDCGHVFQNPRLSLDGLDFYYRDFYDGLSVSSASAVFGRMNRSYLARAAMLKPFGTPAAWLDVGTGHGHFCNGAREVWPDTRFDGLDMAAAVRDAEARGWVATAHCGQFPELAAGLVHRYDTISMYHYLEHTRDPFAELDAAAEVLPMRRASAHRAARPRVTARPAAGLVLAALVPAPAPAPHADRQPQAGLGRAWVHGPGRGARRRPPGLRLRRRRPARREPDRPQSVRTLGTGQCHRGPADRAQGRLDGGAAVLHGSRGPGQTARGRGPRHRRRQRLPAAGPQDTGRP